MTTIIPLCSNCKFFDEKNTDGNFCEAFPEGIPKDILNAKFKHTKKHPDQDNDIVFEKREE